MLCPLLQYLVYGYYIGDNFQKIFQKPDARTCHRFVKDCSSLFELFEEKMDNIKKGKLICTKLLYNTIHMLETEDMETLCTEKMLDVDWNEFFDIFRNLRREISDKEDKYLTNYIDHIFNCDFSMRLYIYQFFDKLFCDISNRKIKVNVYYEDDDVTPILQVK